MAYRSLTPAEQARFDPMITGFNPADMYAADHIRRVLTTFPGVFSGIGEFTIHKEFVSSKVSGETASLTNPALDRILDFAAEAGLVVILHSDIDMPFAKTGRRAGLPDADEGAAEAAPEDLDHLGAHRPRPRRPPGAGVGGRGGAQSQPRRDRGGDAGGPGAQPSELRHLVGRGGEVRRLLAAGDRARGGDAEQVPRPVPVRDRHGGAGDRGGVRTACSTCGSRSGGS